MERYNYLENVKEDIKNYIEENYEKNEILDYNTLYDDMFIADSITGNASGSYYCNTWRAEESLCHNTDLLAEACEEFGCELSEDAEKNDVTIRCYLLGQALSEVLEEREEY